MLDCWIRSPIKIRYDHYQRDYMLNEGQYFSRYYSIFQLCSLSYYHYQCICIFKRTKHQAHLRGFFCLFYFFLGAGGGNSSFSMLSQKRASSSCYFNVPSWASRFHRIQLICSDRLVHACAPIHSTLGCLQLSLKPTTEFWRIITCWCR